MSTTKQCSNSSPASHSNKSPALPNNGGQQLNGYQDQSMNGIGKTDKKSGLEHERNITTPELSISCSNGTSDFDGNPTRTMTPPASPDSYSPNTSHSGNTLPGPCPSVVENLSPPPSATSLDLSPIDSDSSMSKDVAAGILDKLIKIHVKNDCNWEPSGRYRNSSIRFMEDDIGNTLERKQKAREDARKVLELFIKKSLEKSAGFVPSGRYQTVTDLQVIEESPSSRPASYVEAVYHSNEQDDCLEHVAGAIASVSTVTASSRPLSPLPLLTAKEGTTLDVTENHEIVKTTIKNEPSGGVHIHQTITKDSRRSSNTSLSSILDDGDSNIELRNRKKKSLITKVKERVRHSLRRSRKEDLRDNRSETDMQVYSTATVDERRNKPRLKSKKMKKQSSKKRDKFEQYSSAHSHHFMFHGFATTDSAGLNDQVLRDDDSESQSEWIKRGVLSKVRAHKKKSKKSNSSYEAERKKLKEMLKESKKNKKVNRTESTSSESIFKRFSLKRSNAVHIDSPTKGDSVGRAASFNLSSFFKRKDKSLDYSHSTASDSKHLAVSSPSAPVSRHQSDSRPYSSNLHVPHEQIKSKSAEELPSPRTGEQEDLKRPPRLVPRHSRSRSAQDSPTANTMTSSRLGFVSQGNVSSRQRSGLSSTLPRGSRSMEVTQNALQDGLMRTYVHQEIDSIDDNPPSSVQGALRDGLALPLQIEADVTKNKSVVVTPTGDSVVKSVTEVDGVVRFDAHSSRDLQLSSDSEMERIMRKPYHERTQSEQDRVLDQVVSKLERIAKDYEQSKSSSSSYANTPLDEQASTKLSVNGAPSHRVIPASRITPAGIMDDGKIPDGDSTKDSVTSKPITDEHVKELASIFRTRGDYYALNSSLNMLSKGTILQNYESFENVINKVIPREEPELQKIAILFSWTATILSKLGQTGSTAKAIKENTLRYFEDKLAQYIIGNGGWDSMIEESDDEVD